jgi:hypothetical protein
MINTENAIIRTLETEGPRSAGQLAELMGEDAETIKTIVQDMISAGTVVKAGAHRYQLPAGHKPASVQLQPAPVAIKPDPDAFTTPAPEPMPEKTVASVLADLERRLNRQPIQQLEDKQAALLELARITGTGPLRQMLVEIAHDLERAA